MESLNVSSGPASFRSNKALDSTTKKKSSQNIKIEMNNTPDNYTKERISKLFKTDHSFDETQHPTDTGIGIYAEINNNYRKQEFEKLQQYIQPGYELQTKASTKKRSIHNPVLNISDTLKQSKTERIGTEDQLIKKIAKVNLDRTILFREKQNVLWQERSKLSQNLFEEELIKQK
jgi:hypothetical protein